MVRASGLQVFHKFLFFLATPVGAVNIIWIVTMMSSVPVVKVAFGMISIRIS
jgi:hypothetical protein